MCWLSWQTTLFRLRAGLSWCVYLEWHTDTEVRDLPRVLSHHVPQLLLWIVSHLPGRDTVMHPLGSVQLMLMLWFCRAVDALCQGWAYCNKYEPSLLGEWLCHGEFHFSQRVVLPPLGICSEGKQWMLVLLYWVNTEVLQCIFILSNEKKLIPLGVFSVSLPILFGERSSKLCITNQTLSLQQRKCLQGQEMRGGSHSHGFVGFF